VEYQADGDLESRDAVLDPVPGYRCYPHLLLDTCRHSHQGQWNNVRKAGGWPHDAGFAQGNAILLKHDLPHFPLWSLPALHQDHASWLSSWGACMEVVSLESGLYAGDRDTEPRAALIVHVVLSRNGDVELPQPRDVFIINLHLTTLLLEREGIPAIDERASQIRLRQLECVLTDIVSRYNGWRAQRYRIRGEHVVVPGCPCDDCHGVRKHHEHAAAAWLETKGRRETHRRAPPLWVIAGDFNFTPDSAEYAMLTRRGFVSLVHGGTKARGLGKAPTMTVDYVFAGPRFEAIDPVQAEEYRVHRNHVDVDDEVKVSDHCPLLADIPVFAHDDATVLV
jgi:endonuclease/exonuclease/phosphatase family metal-dependent hydrolase